MTLHAKVWRSRQLASPGAAQHVQYYPYGNVRSGSVATDKMFTGQQREGFSRIGAYFYKGRFYATGLGHFLSADSSTADGLDRYAYVRFNPLRYNDPTGHDPNDGLLWNPVTGQPTASPTPGCDNACGLRGVQAGCAMRPDAFFCPGYPGRGGGGSSSCDALCWATIAGLLQCAANYYGCTHGGVPSPMPLCGVGAGTCSAPPASGDEGGCGVCTVLGNVGHAVGDGFNKVAAGGRAANHAIDDGIASAEDAVGKAVKYCVSSAHLFECYERLEVFEVGVVAATMGVILITAGCGGGAIGAAVTAGAGAAAGAAICGLSITGGGIVIFGGGAIASRAFVPWHEREESNY